MLRCLAMKKLIDVSEMFFASIIRAIILMMEVVPPKLRSIST